VWKVYPDGRPDELVRGVDLIGTPLSTFSRIVAAGDDHDVFNGVCGAESGWVPVSASSPSLLIKEVEVQRHEKQNDRPPLLAAPGPTEVGA
jgi:predicted Zn-dependent protease